MKKILSNFHPVLIGIFPILTLYSYNIDQVLINYIIMPIAIGLGASVLIWGLSGLIMKSIRQGAVWTSLFLIIFFSFGHIPSINQYLLIAISLGLIIGSFIFIYRSDSQLQKVNQFLNVFSLVLVLVTLFQIIPYEYARARGRTRLQTEQIPASEKKANDFPDIYYFIFDRYANQPVLEKYFNFDNSDFIEYLEEKGFFTANQSYANYPKTFNSLASSLNFKYLNYLSAEVGEETSDRAPFYELMDNNQVISFLKEHGYTIHHFGDWWQPTRTNPNADYNYNYFILKLNEFTQQLIRTTLAGPVYNHFFLSGELKTGNGQRIVPDREFAYYSSKKEVIERNNYRMKQIKKAAGMAGPKFVFAHILLPHDPFVFDSECQPTDEEKQEKMTRDEKYINQLICVNQLIKEKVDYILAVSADEPIIIIQADEGPFPEPIWSGEKEYGELNADEIEIKFGILNALYLPEFEKDILYPTLSPVNTFRIVFNHYFGTELELLEDRNFNIYSEKLPYKLTEVQF